ncbi:CDP-glucose 4,6-dehydratase [Clostridium felsineum]|uniref:CDP-glucose 4,6-dehydratase n=1 Tax=Clostridium felsineum TaxID=36839 RepID=UPI00098C6D6B|nr:CDP-glucose 4,6-dehydratase [Clostridium felsineum]URZ15996.1 CDP-glucose 4,6-dehydratase [Clostridium felsineum DSM 794]
MDELFAGAYKDSKVLLTGNTGFKGSWLSIWLNKLGAKVTGYSLESSDKEPSMFRICNLENKVTNIIGDVRNLKKLKQVFNDYKPEIVFHLAAQPLVRVSYKNPIETYETNVMGTVNVLEAAKDCKSVKAVIIITTDKCYENKEYIYGYRENDPMGGYDPYSSSKGCAELVVSAYRNSFYDSNNIGLASVRAGNVIGGGDWAQDRLIPDFIRATLKNRKVLVRNPYATRPWQHVLEPLSGYLWLGALMLKDSKKYSSGWNFGPNDTDVLDVEEILNLCIDSYGDGNIEIDNYQQLHEANLLKLDISKAKYYLKWYPIWNVKQSVDMTMKWYKEFYENQDGNMYQYTLRQIYKYEQDAKKNDLLWY